MLHPIIVSKFSIYGNCLVTHTGPDLFRMLKNEAENIIRHKMTVNLICVSVSVATVFTIVTPKAKYTPNVAVKHRKGRGSIQIISKINPAIQRRTLPKFLQENSIGRNYSKGPPNTPASGADRTRAVGSLIVHNLVARGCITSSFPEEIRRM